MNDRKGKEGSVTHILPPSNRICHVTTRVPNHTSIKTPVNTISVCFGVAVNDKRKLRSRENTRGPLRSASVQSQTMKSTQEQA